MAISDTGYWILDEKGMDKEHAVDERVLDSIICLLEREFRSPPKIIDLGCGRCDYVNGLLSHGFDVVGVDGNPATGEYCSDPERILIRDLSKPLDLDQQFDFVMCLEVGEHIPAQFEDALFQNMDRLCRSGGIVLLSWAVEGQPGYGHVNCHNNAYVKSKFYAMGYENAVEHEDIFRQQTQLWWFRDTLMLFKKP